MATTKSDFDMLHFKKQQEANQSALRRTREGMRNFYLACGGLVTGSAVAAAGIYEHYQYPEYPLISWAAGISSASFIVSGLAGATSLHAQLRDDARGAAFLEAQRETDRIAKRNGYVPTYVPETQL